MTFKLLDIIKAILIVMAIFTNCYALERDDLDIDSSLLKAMKAYQVPVVGYAIIKNNHIIAANTLTINTNINVSVNSLFQAASISKSVSAYGALKLVTQKKLKLNESVNDQLISWKIPVNEHNKNNPVTLRKILDMTAGLSVSGFSGYAQDEQLPKLSDILDGKNPANNEPVHVFYKPGTKYFYSGGAFQVLQQLMEDVTKQPFQTWMQAEIFKPLNMENSFFQFPLNSKIRSLAVPGFLMDGNIIKGGWYNYAASAAGGLWSTPTDLAKFTIFVSNSYLGINNTIVSKAIAKQMLTRQKNTDYGLGVVINGAQRTLNFRKAGHNLGYHSELLMFPYSGDGAVIMTNSENGEYIINYFMPIIAKKYNWPCYFPFFDELIEIPKYAC